MTRVVMLYSREYAHDDAARQDATPYLPDVRLQKESHTLAHAGYDVTILAWDRVGKLPAQTLENAPGFFASMSAIWDGDDACAAKPITVTHIHVPAGYRTGRRLLVPMLRFWLKAAHELRRARPDVIHANNLDTLPIAILYHWLTGIPVIYDAREYYPGMVRGSAGSLLSRMLDGLEWFLAPRASAIITVGERLAARYRKPGRRVEVVHNSHPPICQTEDGGQAVRHSLGIPDGALLVVYVGMLTPDRVIVPLLEAVSTLDRVWLAVGGQGPQAALVEQAAVNCPRIRWLGHLPLEQVASMVLAGDVVYYGLDAQNPNSFYFMPNLAFFAFGAGRPLLVTPVGEIAEVVRTEQCGLVLDSASAEAVQRGLHALSDAALRTSLSERARVLGQQRYQWGHAAQTLLQVYTEVLQKCEEL